MKKRLAKITAVILGAFLFFAGGVYAGAEFVEWAGRGDYEATIQILEEISLRRQNLEKEVNELEESRGTLEADKVALKSQVNELDNTINEAKRVLDYTITETNSVNGKGNRYDTLHTGVNDLAETLGVGGRVDENPGQGQTSQELEQAIKDMGSTRNKAQEVLNEFDEE